MDGFVFPGDDPVRVDGPFDVVGTDNPEWVYSITTPTQAGTHIQGPHYFLEDGATIDTFSLDRFEGWAYLVDSTKRGTDTTAHDLQAQLGHCDLNGQNVLLRTGHMDELVAGEPLRPETRPGLSIDGAQWLIDQRINMVAIDSVGLESRESQHFEVNVMLCQQEILILEGLVGLRAITTERVWLEAMPLKVGGVEGTPCRAIAKVPDGFSSLSENSP